MRAVLSVLSFALMGCGGPDPVQSPPVVDNLPPVIAGFARTVDHDLPAQIQLSVTDPEGDPITVTVGGMPGWMSFDPATLLISGTPGIAAVATSPELLVVARDTQGSSSATSTITVKLGTSTLIPDGPWLQQTPHFALQDGSPIESEHFLVYGGFASVAARQQVSAFLEATLTTLLTRLGAGPESTEFPPGGRLHVYIDKYQLDRAFGGSATINGWAFRDGLIVMSPDAPRFVAQGYTTARWEGLVTHELMHDVEFLLIGRNASIGATDVWFREGIASYMAGLAPGGLPLTSTSASTLQSWRTTMASVPGGGNPIGIHIWATDWPPQIIAAGTTGNYYLWFAQAVRYMASDEGLGIGDEGLRGVYEDMKAGISFATSFETRTGLSLAAFEAEFWTRMKAFLS